MIIFSKERAQECIRVATRYLPVPEDTTHSYDNEIGQILTLCLMADVRRNTFVLACSLWQRYRFALSKNISLQGNCNTPTKLACIVALASEMCENSRFIDHKELQEYGELVFGSHCALEKLTKRCYIDCFCLFLRALNCRCLTVTTLNDFEGCMFAQFSKQRLLLTHEPVPYRSASYEYAKLWFDFALLYGYGKHNFVALLAVVLMHGRCQSTQNECLFCSLRLTFACNLNLPAIATYGYKMLGHLFSAFDQCSLLYDRYEFPAVWEERWLVERARADAENSAQRQLALCLQCKSAAAHQTSPASKMGIFRATKRPSLPPVVDVQVVDLQKKYVKDSQVGHGTYGIVYKMYDKLAKQHVCVKTFKENAFAREICIVMALGAHPNILPMIGCGFDAEQTVPWLATPFHPGSDLQQILSCERLNQQVGRRIMLAVTTAVAHMHRNGFVHFDVKPSNVLCDRNGENVQLLDFSLSHRLQNRLSCRLHGYDESMIASIPYRAPELLLRGIHGDFCQRAVYVYAADAWSLGALFYRIVHPLHDCLVNDAEISESDALVQICNLQATNLHKMSFYQRAQSVFKNTTKNERLWNIIIDNADVNAADLLDSFLEMQPTLRIGAEQALRHPYFFKDDKSKQES